MKHIIEILIIVAIALSIGALASCTPEKEAAVPPPPPPPEPHEILKQQVTQERELREEAEERAESATSRVNFWEGTSVFIFVGACIAFITGTAIGSRGRKHAGS